MYQSVLEDFSMEEVLSQLSPFITEPSIDLKDSVVSLGNLDMLNMSMQSMPLTGGLDFLEGDGSLRALPRYQSSFAEPARDEKSSQSQQKERDYAKMGFIDKLIRK